MLSVFTPQPLSWRGLAMIAGALALMYVLCVAMYVVRVIYTSDFTYWFVPGNLILAWIPFVLAMVTRLAWTGSGSGRPLAVLAGSLWLLFLPNAPYVVTDLQHYRPTPLMPGWYDGAMLGVFAVTGIFAGLVSLYVMHTLVSETFGAVVSWLFVLAVLPLCGFGIYLGRVLRWNSWSAVTAPLPLARDITEVARFPLVHGEAYAMTAVFAALLAVSYAVFYSLAAGMSSQNGS